MANRNARMRFAVMIPACLIAGVALADSKDLRLVTVHHEDTNQHRSDRQPLPNIYHIHGITGVSKAARDMYRSAKGERFGCISNQDSCLLQYDKSRLRFHNSFELNRYSEVDSQPEIELPPLVVHFSDEHFGNFLVVMVNFSDEDKLQRMDQAKLLRRWCSDQRLPVIGLTNHDSISKLESPALEELSVDDHWKCFKLNGEFATGSKEQNTIRLSEPKLSERRMARVLAGAITRKWPVSAKVIRPSAAEPKPPMDNAVELVVHAGRFTTTGIAN